MCQLWKNPFCCVEAFVIMDILGENALIKIWYISVLSHHHLRSLTFSHSLTHTHLATVYSPNVLMTDLYKNIVEKFQLQINICHFPTSSETRANYLCIDAACKCHVANSQIHDIRAKSFECCTNSTGMLSKTVARTIKGKHFGHGLTVSIGTPTTQTTVADSRHSRAWINYVSIKALHTFINYFKTNAGHSINSRRSVAR